MKYLFKVEFRDYPSGQWHDWSEYVVNAPTISRRVESDIEGEAGVIVFDNTSLEFYYEAGNPVYNAFNLDLTSKIRYLLKISHYAGTQYVKLFEGMVDFTTITFPDLSNSITFDVVDKISAIGILASEPVRGAEGVFNQHVGNDFSSSYYLRRDTTVNNGLEIYREFNGSIVSMPANTIQKGMVLSYEENKFLLIKNIYEENIEAPGGTQVKVLKVVPVMNNEEILQFGTEPYYLNYKKLLSRNIYNTDCHIYSGGIPQSYDGLKIIKSIIQSQWSDINFINRTGMGSFPVPLEYYVKLIDENPFDNDPLNALKYLADSLQCYIYINRNGDLVMQKKASLNENGVSRSIGSTRIVDSVRKYFWNKIVDGVEVKTNSWVADAESGEFLEGYSIRTKSAPGSAAYVKPKNKITKEVIVADSSITTKEELDLHAESFAVSTINFYGKRRSCYTHTLDLDSNTVYWDLLDNITLNGVKYFYTSLNIDLESETIEVDFIEFQGHEYDYRQVLIGLGDNSSIQSVTASENRSSYVGSGSGTSNVSLIFNYPLDKEAGDVSLKFTDNFMLTESGDLDLIQGIKETDAPTFAGLTVTGPAYYNDGTNDFEFYHSGNFDSGNFVTIDTEQTITGLKTFTNRFRIGDIEINSQNYFHLENTAGGYVKLLTKGDANSSGNVEIRVRDVLNNINQDFIIDAAAGVGFDVTLFNVNDKFKIENNDVNVSASFTAQNLDASGFIKYDNTEGSDKFQFKGSASANLIEFDKFGRIGFGTTAIDDRELTFNNSYGQGSASFVGGWQSGSGWWLESEDLGNDSYNYHLTVDDMTIRGTLRLYELLVQQIRATNGNLLVTATAKSNSALLNGTVGSLTNVDYFECEDVTEHGIAPFHDNDIIMCQVVNLSGATYNSAHDFVTDDYLVKRLVYKVIKVEGLKVAVAPLYGAPANKGAIEEGDGFVRIGNLYDAERRGMVGIYSDEYKAPFIRVTDGVDSWSGWKSQHNVQAQVGRLDNLSDDDFGGQLSGYGAYLKDNIYMKGSIFVKSNNSLSLNDNSIMIGSITGTAKNAIKIANNISMVSVPDPFGGGTFYSISDADISGIFGYDRQGNENFALRLDGTASVAGWDFDYKKLFKSSGTNTVRLETADTLTGFALNNGGADLIKIGAFENLTPTLSYINYTSSLLTGYDFNSTAELSNWSVVDILNNLSIDPNKHKSGSGSLKFSECEEIDLLNHVVADLNQEMTNIGNITGKAIDVSFYLRNEIGVAYQSIESPRITITIEEQKPNTGNYWKAKGKVVIKETKAVLWDKYNFTAKIDSTATKVRIRIRYDLDADYGSGEKQFSNVYIDALSVHYYNNVFTNINQHGFHVQSSPSNYIRFDGSLKIGTSDLRVNGLPVIRWWGNIDDVNYLDAQTGDMAFETNTNSTTIKLYDGQHWHTLFQQYGGSEIPGIEDLDNVSVTERTDGDILTWNASEGKWINVVQSDVVLTGHSQQITIESDNTASISLSAVPRGIEYVSLSKNGQLLRRNIDYELEGSVINLKSGVSGFNVVDSVYCEWYS